ncbi:MAG: hypothetical protein IPK57_19410 [Chitinophagaceae bacterium]|nr:hypothetical protein [Chitinophagaceae bacterium]
MRLKDASTTALYGSRAANGVIMITTKKGKKNRNTLNFKLMQGVSSRGIPEYDRANASQFYVMMWESYRNSLLYAASPQPLAVANQNATNGIKGLLGYNPFNVPANQIGDVNGIFNSSANLLWADDLDWTKELVRMGNRKDATLSFSGGNEKSDYFGSFGYTDEKGYIIRSDWRRFSGRVNINTQPTKWFKVGINLSGAVNKSNQASDGSSTGLVNPFYFTRAMGPPVNCIIKQPVSIYLTLPVIKFMTMVISSYQVCHSVRNWVDVITWLKPGGTRNYLKEIRLVPVIMLMSYLHHG